MKETLKGENMAVKQISIFVENKEGRIKKAIDTSAKVANEVKASDVKARSRQLRRDN